MIGLVTDSNAQMPAELVERFGVEVVPLTVTVDGVAYAEGVDLDADEFYDRLRAGAPQVATSQPSPGRFAAAYDAVATRGAEAILSVHIGSAISGTINSARLAAASAPVPVHIVDTATASFAVACCVWEAAEALGAGAGLEEAAAAARAVSATVGNVFVVRGLELARAGGRLADDADALLAIPVLTLTGGAMRTVGEVADAAEAATVMAATVRSWATKGASDDPGVNGPRRLRVGVAVADAETLPVVESLEEVLRAAPEVAELVRYRVGPSVGVHTGPGTVGAMYYPVGPKPSPGSSAGDHGSDPPGGSSSSPTDSSEG